MRTTINLPDRLAATAQQQAAAEGRTFASLVEEALRALLDSDRRPTGYVEPLPTYGRADGQVLVDLEDRDAVWAALEDAAEAGS